MSEEMKDRNHVDMEVIGADERTLNEGQIGESEMTSTPTGSRLPPGRDGIPLLGETFSFAKNPLRFMEKRLASHGRIFRSNIVGRRAAVIAGPDAVGRFM